MKWTVKEWLPEAYLARKGSGLTAYIYRSLRWPDFLGRGAPAYEVRCGGEAIAVIRFDGKGASVTALAAAAGCPGVTDLDLVELALWVHKLRSAPGIN